MGDGPELDRAEAFLGELRRKNDHSSHNPKEAMAMDDFAEAARLLYGMLDELVG